MQFREAFAVELIAVEFPDHAGQRGLGSLDLAGVVGIGDAVLFHEGFQLADEAIDLLIGQAVEFVTEGNNPFEFEKFVHLRVAQTFDGLFGLQVEGGGFLFDRRFQRFLFGEPVGDLDDLGLVGFGVPLA